MSAEHIAQVLLKATERDSRTGCAANSGDRLDGWKEIACYLRRSIRSVQRWEKKEALPVVRHQHERGATVYAYREELDAWWHQGAGHGMGEEAVVRPQA